MKFLTAQPDTDYYVWQLQVQMHNFKKFGIEDKTIILFGYNPKIGINEKALEFKETTDARVIFLPDTRDLSQRLYLPSLRPHIIKQLYTGEYADILQNKAVLYMDCDVIFTKIPNLKDYIDKRKIYLSDTRSYIGAAYIREKGLGLLEKMCQVVGINPTHVINNQEMSGGAQYLFTSNFNLSYDFWNKVERDCNILYKTMLVTSEKNGAQHPIQSWTADMWALLWNIWLMGLDTEIIDELSFCWATSPVSELESNNIYHNAGVTENEKSYMFYKGDFISKSPFDVDLSYVSNTYCSSFYVNEICETAAALKLKQ